MPTKSIMWHQFFRALFLTIHLSLCSLFLYFYTVQFGFFLSLLAPEEEIKDSQFWLDVCLSIIRQKAVRELVINEKLAVILKQVSCRSVVRCSHCTTVSVIFSSTDTEQGDENPNVPLSVLNKLPSYFKLEIQAQLFFFNNLLHVSSGKNKGWLDSIMHSDCVIPQNRFCSETGFNFKLWMNRSSGTVKPACVPSAFLFCAYLLPNRLTVHDHILIFFCPDMAHFSL